VVQLWEFKKTNGNGKNGSHYFQCLAKLGCLQAWNIYFQANEIIGSSGLNLFF
jgi:hypothetical protein